MIPKWLYSVSGSTFAVGILHYYMKSEENQVCASTSNFQPTMRWDNNWDKRSPSSLIKPSAKNNVEEREKVIPKATRHIFLIRHGQYIHDKDDSKRKLTPLGREQAKLVGKRLKDMQIDYTCLVRSSMTRAIETSDIINSFFPGIEVRTSDLLREGAPIPPEPPFVHWVAEYSSFRDGPRIEGAFRKFFHRAKPSQKEDSYEIIVCHANVIRYFLCRLLQIPPEAWLRFSLHHCSISHVCIYPSGHVVVRAIGDYGFLPSDKVTRK